MNLVLLCILCLFSGYFCRGADTNTLANCPVPEINLFPLEPKVVMLRSPTSHPVSWKELSDFLRNDDSNNHKYTLDTYDCKNFSLELFRRAQNANIGCFIDLVGFAATPTGHAVVEFPTTDKGVLYVDFTPVITDKGQIPSKALVMLSVGLPMIKVPLNQVPADFQNNMEFFNNYRDLQIKIIAAQESIKQFASENRDNPEAGDKIAAAYRALNAYKDQRSIYQPAEPDVVSNIQRW